MGKHRPAPPAAPVSPAPANRPPRPSAGITVTNVPHYQVGPYRYTDLACAEAELRRRVAAGDVLLPPEQSDG